MESNDSNNSNKEKKGENKINNKDKADGEDNNTTPLKNSAGNNVILDGVNNNYISTFFIGLSFRNGLRTVDVTSNIQDFLYKVNIWDGKRKEMNINISPFDQSNIPLFVFETKAEPSSIRGCTPAKSNNTSNKKSSKKSTNINENDFNNDTFADRLLADICSNDSSSNNNNNNLLLTPNRKKKLQVPPLSLSPDVRNNRNNSDIISSNISSNSSLISDNSPGINDKFSKSFDLNSPIITNNNNDDSTNGNKNSNSIDNNDGSPSKRIKIII
jgi:hypothetical protein